jgi:hypothetical protein
MAAPGVGQTIVSGGSMVRDTKRESSSSRRPAPVRVERHGIHYLDPRAREIALEMAAGDVDRIEVVGRREFILR